MAISLSAEDLTRLFPGWLYLVPETVYAQEAPAPLQEMAASEPAPAVPNPTPPAPEPKTIPPAQGDAIQWRLKPGARVVFVLSQAEFADKALTQFLKHQVVAAQLQTEWIGFGIAQGPAPIWTDLPVNLAVGFGIPVPEGAEGFYQVSSLEKARTDPGKHAALILALGALRQRIQSESDA